MNTEIDQNLGSLSVSVANKTMSAEDCQEICSLMKAIQIKAQEAELDTNTTAFALQGSFAGEQGFQDQDLADMAMQ